MEPPQKWCACVLCVEIMDRGAGVLRAGRRRGERQHTQQHAAARELLSDATVQYSTVQYRGTVLYCTVLYLNGVNCIALQYII